MSRVLFVTVGTSAITAEGLGVNVGGFLNLTEEEKLERSGALRPKLTEAHLTFWRHLPERQPQVLHYRDTSAELVTTLGLMGSAEVEPDFFKTEGNKIVLLASNTAEGELAAHVNADVLHEMLLGSKCDCAGVLRTCRRVLVEVIRGMEPAKHFENLLDGLTEKVRPYEGAKAAFNVTGGFKGVIPYITWLTFQKFKGAPMYYQHEKMSTFMRIVFSSGANPEPKEENAVQPRYPEYQRAPRPR